MNSLLMFRIIFRNTSFKLCIFTICLILFSNRVVQAQSPYFLTDGAKWMYYSWETTEPGMNLVRYILEEDLIAGDTTLNSILYKKLNIRRQVENHVIPLGTSYYTYDILPQCYLRHDTLSRKMYLYSDTSASEILIWDFSLSGGDTIPLMSMTCGNRWVVDSIQPIILFGQTTNQFFLDDPFCAPGQFDNYMIEGIGSVNGLTFFNPIFPSVSGGLFLTRLECFESGDSVFTPSGWGSCPFFTSTNEDFANDFFVSVFPNPFSTGFYVQAKNLSPLINSEIQIFDL